jgi:hypothetical protein
MFERFDAPVRCSAGHLFTTIWIPLWSLKAVRVGWKRYQYCPAGRHWATATRLEWAATVPTDADLAQAALVHDVRIP